MSSNMADRGVRKFLAGVFGLHAGARLGLALLRTSSSGGYWIITGLALLAMLQLLRTAGGRVIGMMCLGLLTLQMVWMLVDFGVPLLAGGPWLATYLATAIALIAQGMAKPSARLAAASLVLVCLALAWTIYAYASVMASQL